MTANEQNDLLAFEINLDLPAEDRFKEISEHFAEELNAYYTETMYDFPPLVRKWFQATSWIW